MADTRKSSTRPRWARPALVAALVLALLVAITVFWIWINTLE
jgi:high-affinity Fe2+/Pb2+ permease